jgi:hypothetical protein
MVEIVPAHIISGPPKCVKDQEAPGFEKGLAIGEANEQD